MATLHMEVETARKTNAVMEQAVKEFMDLIIRIRSSNSELQVAWMGNSATEYFGEVEQWAASANQTMEGLNVLTTRLANEVSEWEQMASKLS